MKAVVALFALALLVGAGAFWVWRSGSPADGCADTVFTEARSADGRWIAAAYDRRCQAARFTQVALRRRGSGFAPTEADVVYAARDSERPQLHWEGDPEQLVIETASRSVAREERSWRRVPVQVRRRR